MEIKDKEELLRHGLVAGAVVKHTPPTAEAIVLLRAATVVIWGESYIPRVAHKVLGVSFEQHSSQGLG